MKTLDQDFPPIKEQHGRSIKPAGVYIKLMQARIELQGRKLNKSGHNKFAGYHYFELGDFLPVVQEIFAEIGLCSVISYGLSEAWLTITDIDDGSAIAICSPMADASTKGSLPIQALGSAQTYLRRYLWLTAMEIVEHDALDATTGKADNKKTPPPPQAPAVDDPDAPPSPEEMTALAKEVVSIFKDGDIAKTNKHILDYFTDKHGVNNDQLSDFWSYLDSESAMRSTLRAYIAIQYAATTEALDKVWARVPKHAQTALMPYFDTRKQALQPMEAAA